MKQFTYIDRNKGKGTIAYQVFAEDIKAADAAARNMGFAPERLSVAIGVRFVVYDTHLQKDVYKSPLLKGPHYLPEEVLQAWKRDHAYNPHRQSFIEVASVDRYKLRTHWRPSK